MPCSRRRERESNVSRMLPRLKHPPVKNVFRNQISPQHVTSAQLGSIHTLGVFLYSQFSIYVGLTKLKACSVKNEVFLFRDFEISKGYKREP